MARRLAFIGRRRSPQLELHRLHETLGFTALTTKGLRALVPHQLGVRVDHSISVFRPVDEVYRFFRNFKNLGAFSLKPYRGTARRVYSATVISAQFRGDDLGRRFAKKGR